MRSYPEHIPPRGLVHVRFDWARAFETSTVFRANLPVVPLLGEVVNLGGNPYVVTERGWAVGDPYSEHGEPRPLDYNEFTCPLYAYVTVRRLG